MFFYIFVFMPCQFVNASENNAVRIRNFGVNPIELWCGYLFSILTIQVTKRKNIVWLKIKYALVKKRKGLNSLRHLKAAFWYTPTIFKSSNHEKCEKKFQCNTITLQFDSALYRFFSLTTNLQYK